MEHGDVGERGLLDALAEVRQQRSAAAADPRQYEVCIYVEHGYFSYTVSGMAKAINHGQVIMQSGVYRHVEGQALEFYKVLKVKIVGPDLETQYPDVFHRT